MNSTKLNLIYYKNILDIAMFRFFNNFNDKFAKNDGKYVLSAQLSMQTIKTIIQDYVVDELSKYVKPFNILNPNYYFVIGSCMPKDNILLLHRKNSEYFPEKLKKLLDSNINVKYVLKEKDISIDIHAFNRVFIDIFNDLFADQSKLKSLLKQKTSNVLFIQHRSLDCYAMFKTLKFLYGKTNCNNMWVNDVCKGVSMPKTVLVAINDIINSYVHNKAEMNKSKDFKKAVNEVKEYVDSFIFHKNA